MSPTTIRASGASTSGSVALSSIFTGFVPDEELPFIYDGARVFLYLSLFEGFGLPPLEAMACGVPVICSNTTSLPEVVGDAGITITPTDSNAVALALKQILSDTLLAEKMRESGRDRSRLFSWENTARATLAIYGQVCSAAMSQNEAQRETQ